MKNKIVTAAVIVILLIGAALGAKYSIEQKKEMEIPHQSYISQPEKREDTSQQIAVLFCGIDGTNWLTDVIIYGVLDMDQNTVRLLQIPRDSFVGEEYPTGKINAVYGNPSQKGQGIQELKKVLYSQLSLSVDYYITITLEGFRNAIDAFGGIMMNVPYKIEYLPGKTLYPGEQLLSGEEAEWFVRYRAGYATGDIGRMEAQKLFLKSCFETAQNQGIPSALSALAKSYSQIKTDMPLDQMLLAAKSVFALKEDDISVFLAPGKGVQNQRYAVYQWDAVEMAQLLNTHFRPQGENFSAQELNIRHLAAENIIQQKKESVEEIFQNTAQKEDEVLSDPSVQSQEEIPEEREVINSWRDFLSFLEQKE